MKRLFEYYPVETIEYSPLADQPLVSGDDSSSRPAAVAAVAHGGVTTNKDTQTDRTVTTGNINNQHLYASS